MIGVIGMTAGVAERGAMTVAVVAVMISSGGMAPGDTRRGGVAVAMTSAARGVRKWNRPKESR